MKPHTILFYTSLIISTACLSAAFIFAGYWMVVPALLVLVLCWFFSSRRPAFWLAACSLLGYVLLAAIGTYVNLSSELLIIACTAALVSWEIIQFKHSSYRSSLTKTATPLEKYHLRSLGLATAAGLALALVSSAINMQLPFGVVALLVLIAMGCLVFGMQYITKKEI